MSTESIGSFVSLLVSVATLALSFLTYRWTQKQSLIETFDLVPYWKWYFSEQDVGANASLGCHNRSDKSIFVTKIEVLTRGFLFYSRPLKGVFYENPADNPLPLQIRPDGTSTFQIDVSNAIEAIDFSKKKYPWLFRFDRHTIMVRVTTASGTKKEIQATEFVPQDLFEQLKIGKNL